MCSISKELERESIRKTCATLVGWAKFPIAPDCFVAWPLYTRSGGETVDNWQAPSMVDDDGCHMRERASHSAPMSVEALHIISAPPPQSPPPDRMLGATAQPIKTRIWGNFCVLYKHVRSVDLRSGTNHRPLWLIRWAAVRVSGAAQFITILKHTASVQSLVQCFLFCSGVLGSVHRGKTEPFVLRCNIETSTFACGRRNWKIRYIRIS